jgi:FkbM family methyltransferase
MIDQINQVHLNGVDLLYNDPHDIAAIIETYILDVYKKRNMKNGDIVIDLGAGIGEFAVMASKRVGRRGKVIAIEPSPDDYRTLQKNLKMNHCTNVFPINMAVSDKQETINLSFKGKEFRSSADTLRNIIGISGINSDSIDFIKMDIEGAEKQVIPSNVDLIKGVNYLAMEIHGEYHKVLIPLMNQLGFHFERIRRRNYLIRAFEFALMHPMQAMHIYRTFNETKENPGIGKILSGIEIAGSDSLVVGIFERS